KTFELYFKSEDEMESARASLNTLRIQNLVIEEMSDDTSSMIFIPFGSGNVNAITSHGGTTFSSFGSMFAAGFNEDEDPEKVKYLLRVEIAEQDFAKFKEIVNRLDCYIRYERE